MNNIKVVISEFNNDKYVFEFEDNEVTKLYRLSQSKFRVGLILIGRIRDIKKDLNCCFVEMGEGNIGYLSFADCNERFLLNRQYDGQYKQGDEILVRISKMPVKTKPFSLSMNVEISGELSVVSTKGKGFFASQKINSQAKEKLLSQVEAAFDKEMFADTSCLLRTSSLDASLEKVIEEIRRNKDSLAQLISKASSRKVFSVLYEPQKDFIIRLLDNGSANISDVITDDEDIYRELEESSMFSKITLYKDSSMPLRILYNLDRAFSDATAKKVYIPCGGYLIIEPTEALTVIDVNSGKFVGKRTNADSISLVNKEAADMISRQLKLRNISGIVIVDFINCSKEEEDKLITYMRSLVKTDKTKTLVEGFTKLGLMELTRQKIYPSIYEK